MGNIVRVFTHQTYVGVIKPLLFTQSPDVVHSKAVELGSKVGKHRPLRQLASLSWAYKNPRLSQTIHGLEYDNPVGLSAGFDKNARLIPIMQAIGFGHITVGSITSKVCEGNPKPWFHRIPEQKAIVVHVGLANTGREAIAASLRDAKGSQSKARVPVTISVAWTNSQETSTDKEGIDDYVQTLKTLRLYADNFEINISCPNTYGGEPFTTPARLDALLGAIDALNLMQPVYIKMPSDVPWRKYCSLLDVIIRHSVQGVTVSNLRKNRQGIAVSSSVKGGISGLPTQAASDPFIAKTYQKYGDKLTIIGVGGIFTAEDAYRKIRLGASLVDLLTGLIYEGPSLVGSINRGLVKLLDRDGFDSIEDAKGIDAHKV